MKKMLLFLITFMFIVVFPFCVFADDDDEDVFQLLVFKYNETSKKYETTDSYSFDKTSNTFNATEAGKYIVLNKGDYDYDNANLSKDGKKGTANWEELNIGKSSEGMDLPIVYEFEADESCTIGKGVGNGSYYGENNSSAGGTAEDNPTDVFQETIAELNLAVGDFFNKLIGEVVGQKITIQSLVFNDVKSLDANFFSSSQGGSIVHKTVKKQINTWYPVFQEIAAAFYLTGLLVVGLKILLSESSLSRASMKEVATHWITGLAILFFFNVIMKYAFDINEAFVKALKEEFAINGKYTGTYIADPDEYNREAFEFRSPEYRSKYTGILAFGGEELNDAYVKRLGEYRSTGDMMRIMRAYAGATKRLIFVIIWFVLLFQLIILLFKYYKRYFTIAFLIIVFPFTTISYLLDSLKGRRPEAFRMWCVEYFVNVFTQAIHAIIYSIISSVCIKQVVEELNGGTLNWIIIIVAINFLFQGEKIIRKIMGVDGAKSAKPIEDSARAGRAGMGKARQNMGRALGIFTGKG